MRSLKLAALAATLALMAPAVLAAQISNTKHNLNANAYGTGQAQYGEVCVYCHTPHQAMTFVPLWNHDTTAATFTMYTSGTIDGTIDAKPGSVSLACLSCHDGTVGLDALVNLPRSTTLTATGVTMPTDSTGYVGVDLSNDHPVSITYVSGTTGQDMNDPSTLSYARLYNGKVECGSCHDPHDNTNEPFLRAANTNSQLCLDCHNK